MNVFWTILETLLIVSILVFIHELGHFLTARLNKVKINEFALGMGPTLLKHQSKKSGIVYAWRLLPIGGFVSMEGEDENAFNKKKVWQRLIIVAAGALMNIILGFIIVLIIVATSAQLGSTTVAAFNDGATSNAKLQINDQITAINGMHVSVDNDIIFGLLRDTDGAVDITVKRDGEKVVLESVPFVMETAEDGTQLIQLDFKVYQSEKTVGNILKQSVGRTTSIVKMVWLSLVDLVTGRFGFNQLSGPVGIGSAVGEAASQGWSSLALLVAFITINLGVFNLLPLPALDGGRLIFLLIELVRGKPVNPKYEGYVHAAGLIFFFALMIFVTVNDIFRLIR